jgi:hypothetical protein
MSLRYTSRKIMRDLDYSDDSKKELARLMLKHDPRMIAHIYNFDFELIKEHVENSITFLEVADLKNIASYDDFEKTIRLAYSKTRAFKKQLLNFLEYKEEITSKSDYAGYYHSHYRNKNALAKFDLSKIADVIEDMFLYDPLLIFAFNEDYIQRLIDDKVIDLNRISKKVSFSKIEKGLNMTIRKYESITSSRDKKSLLSFMYEYKMNRMWWTGKKMEIRDESKKIQQLEEIFKDRADIKSLILLLVLK